MKVTGAKAHAAHLRRIAGPEMIKAVGAALYTAGQEIEIDAEISITTGAVSGKKHVASKPGEAPNADSHDLDRGIETVLVEPLKVEVSSNAPHSAALEFGTSKMAARPFMRPAVKRKKAAAIALVRNAVSKIIRSAGQGNPKG